MIKKLKIKVILLIMSALLCLLAVIVAGMNAMNYSSVVKDADVVLSMLSENEGSFPDWDKAPGGPGRGGRDFLSPEIQYESRYFSVLLDDAGSVISADVSRIISVSKAEAIAYAQEAYAGGSSAGFTGSFRYICTEEDGNFRIIFLDCGRKLDSFYDFLYASLFMSLLGYIAVLVIVIFLAGKIIRPIAESYEKQKRFITDAGHEIKTPLTIINANVDVLEMDLGSDNECLADIQAQTQRLTSLTNDLVYLSRMDEQEESLPMIEFPVSDLILETASSFKAPAQLQNKTLDLRIQPMLTMKGNAAAIEKLVSILMNNALKYSPEGSAISVDFGLRGKHLTLTVVNAASYFVEQEKLAYAFDRFYRTDSSRNAATGGYGIGLSMAKSIVKAHKGEILAQTADGHSFGITACFPH